MQARLVNVLFIGGFSFRGGCSLIDPRVALGAVRSRLASGSPMNSSLIGSYFRSRLSHMQMLAAWTVLMVWNMTSGFATVDWRDFTQSKKLRT